MITHVYDDDDDDKKSNEIILSKLNSKKEK